MADDCLLKLRDEILGLQSATFELQKWKLIGIGAALTIGLGLSKDAGSSSFLALFAVPFVAGYSDLMIRDYDLRIELLAQFIRSKGGDLGEYEEFLYGKVARSHPWKLGRVATSASSYAANCAVALFSLYYAVRGTFHWYGAAPFLVAALGGVIATFLIDHYFGATMDAIRSLVMGDRHKNHSF